MVIKVDEEVPSIIVMEKKRRKSFGGGEESSKSSLLRGGTSLVLKNKRRASTGGNVQGTSSSSSSASSRVLEGMSIAEMTMIRRLAGNDPEMRKKTIRKLKKWLGALIMKVPDNGGGGDPKNTLEPNMIRVWKALFYCMWMADKPLPQEQLAEQISNLVHVVGMKDKVFMLFVEWFFRTMAREWSWIDRYRLDKFMMLIRRFLRKTLTVMATKKWNKEITTGFLDIIRLYIFNHNSDDKSTKFKKGTGAGADLENVRAPLGLQMHFIDIFLEELAKAGGEKMKSATVMKCIAPFIEEVANNNDDRILKAIEERIFNHLMRQSDVGIDYQEGLMEVDSDEEGEEDEGMEDDDEEMESGEDDEDELENGNATAEDDVYEAEADNGPLDPRAGAVDVILPQLQIDYSLLTEKLAQAGGNKEIRKRNRSRLYSLAARDLVEGKYPLALPDQVEDREPITPKHIEKAAERLVELEESEGPKIRKTKKQRRREAKQRLLLQQHEQLDDTVGSEDSSAFLNSSDLLNNLEDNYSGYVHEQMEKSTDNEDRTDAPKKKKASKRKMNGEIAPEQPTKSKKKYKTIVEFEDDELQRDQELKVSVDRAKSPKKGKGRSKDTVVEIPLPKKKRKSLTNQDNDSPKPLLSPNSKLNSSSLSGALKHYATVTPTSSTPSNSKSRASIRKAKTPTSEEARRKIKFQLHKNLEHEAIEYLPTISKSPTIPYDGSRTPTNGILKKTGATPVRKSFGIKSSPRKNAIDFF